MWQKMQFFRVFALSIDVTLCVQVLYFFRPCVWSFPVILQKGSAIFQKLRPEKNRWRTKVDPKFTNFCIPCKYSRNVNPRLKTRCKRFSTSKERLKQCFQLVLPTFSSFWLIYVQISDTKWWTNGHAENIGVVTKNLVASGSVVGVKKTPLCRFFKFVLLCSSR